MSATADEFLLPTRRPPYIRAPSTGGDDFDTRSEASDMPLTRPTSSIPASRIHPEQVSRRKLFLKLLLFWIGTILWTAALIGLVSGYTAKGVLTSAQKSTFNFLLTVVILILGLTFFEAFKELARHMHGLLSRRFGLQGAEEELMHGFESLLKVARLMFLTPKWSLRVFCLFWLSVNFAAQMMSALISLQVTVVDGHDYNSTYTRSGQVNVSKIDCYYADPECLDIEQAAAMHAHAHIYGQMRTDRRDYDNITDLITSKHDIGVWSHTKKTEFAHRFNEYNENDTQKAYPFFTNRVITSSAGECVQYDVKETPVESTMGDVDASSFTYKTKDGSSPGTILIPKSSLGEDGTTYIYRGVHDPSQASDPKVVCGDRCMYVWVYRNPGKQPPALFQCPITISNVSNAELPEHDIPDAVARVAAVSVALQGRWQGSLKNKKALQFHQYQFIPFRTDREVHFQSNKAIGGFIASFAMQSLYSMVRLNPDISIAGTVPHLGSRLEVDDTPALTAILVSIVVTHLIISIVTFMVARRNG